MARPNKQGLDYFPFDVDFFQDLKIRKLIKYQGGKAVVVYALLLCNIYKQGYYMRWDEELPFTISEQTGFEEAYIREVIKCCMIVGLFSKELYESERILTSKGVQERFADICKIARRKIIISEFNLISSEEIALNSEEIPVYSEETHINSERSTQSKVKEIKEKNNIPHNPPDGEKQTNISFDQFWELYDKKVGKKDSLIKKWLKLSDKERESAMSYIPKYKLAQPNKKYRKNPESFLNQKAWNDELIFDEQSSFLSMPNLLQDKPKDGDLNDKGEIWSDQLQRWLK